jgi:hypothetical protein
VIVITGVSGFITSRDRMESESKGNHRHSRGGPSGGVGKEIKRH